jgi:hypothetical protein
MKNSRLTFKENEKKIILNKYYESTEHNNDNLSLKFNVFKTISLKTCVLNCYAIDIICKFRLDGQNIIRLQLQFLKNDLPIMKSYLIRPLR